MVSLLRETPLSSEQSDCVRTIEISGGALLQILNDILDISKVEAGKLRIEPAPFDLQRALEGVCELLRPRAREKGLRLELDFASGTPKRLVGDAGRIRQILLNLCGNAIKFTSEGGVRISARRLGEDFGADGTMRLEIEVEDTGIGIPPELQPHLFHPFTQGDASTTRRYGGTGLGLAICKRLAELMEGDIRVQSREGEGARFVLSLPLRPAPVSEPIVAEEERAFPPAAPGSPAPLALLAEDHPVNQKVAVRMLEKLGCRVDLAVNGRDAVEKAVGGSYAFILMDVQMPECDGYEATRRIRAREAELSAGRRIPIIAMTANAMPGDRERCLREGMDGYLSKPVRLEALRAALHPYLASVAGAAIA
jgi:CheY-like chemotaxis protein